MKITVVRTEYTDKSTTGVMLLDGQYFGVTLEDTFRDGEKVKDKTCIPAGRYGVDLTFSNKFQKVLPLIYGVPGFDGVRIHGGNTADDTEGCILIASKKVNNDQIMGSLSVILIDRLKTESKPHQIEIINAWKDTVTA
jgi:hypothetical protein